MRKLKDYLIKGRRGMAGMFQALIGIVVGLATFAIGAIVAFLIMANLATNAQVVADGNATAAVNLAQTAAATVPAWLGIFVIAALGSLLLGLVYLYMQGRK